MRKNSGNVLIVTLIAFAGFTVAGYFLLPPLLNKDFFKPREPVPVVDETTNWKTYTGDLFFLQYPADWLMISTTLANNSIEIQGPLGEKLNLTVHKGIGPGIGTETCEIGDKETVKEEKIIIDKSAAKTYFRCSKTNQKSIVVTASEKIPMLTLEYWYQSNNSITSEKILDQILSTFKFL